MRKKVMVICMLPILYMTACKDKDVKTEDNPFEACKVTEYKNGEDVLSFSYGDDGHTTAMELDYYDYNCSYDFTNEGSKCDSTLISTEVKFTYENDRIISGDLYEGGQLSDSKVELEYDANERLNKFTIVDSYDGKEARDEYRFEYNEKGKVIKIQNYDNYKSGGSLELYGYESYEYTQNNISKIEYYHENSYNQERKRNKKWFYSEYKNVNSRIIPELSSTIKLTSDEKISPFYGNIPLLIYNQSFHAFLSENNVITTNGTQTGDNGGSYSENYDYIYNNQNFPTSMQYTYSEGDNYESKSTEVLTYECK